jgi:hypothetical protein
MMCVAHVLGSHPSLHFRLDRLFSKHAQIFIAYETSVACSTLRYNMLLVFALDSNVTECALDRNRKEKDVSQ